MKNSIVVLFIALVFCAACSKDRETASGQKFTIVKQGDGKNIEAKKYMILNFSFQDGKDSAWNDTRKNGYPLVMQKQGIMKPGDRVLEVISMLTKGDSAVFKISAKDLFTLSFHQPIPRKVDSASFFTFNVGIIDALDSAQFGKFREELVAKQNEKALKKQQEQLGKDTVAIDSYLKEKSITTLRTESGLRYVITKPGKGENAKDGQSVKVNYAGYLLSGKYFDTSIEAVAKANGIYREGGRYAPYDLVLGQGGVIPGWELALKLMNKGEKITVYIPSTLAYGSQRRSADIVENSILAFDLELVDITDAKDVKRPR